MSDPVKTIICDIDGTLCPVKAADQSYADLMPYPDMVAQLHAYRSRGFKITLHTARNMRTYEGNVGLINRYTLPVLLDWLEAWRVPYDEIVMGKPWPGHHGVYVDDRSIRPHEFKSMSFDEVEAMIATERRERDQVLDPVRNQPSNIVITMAGLGSRFRKAGYSVPKYEIEVNGRSLFDWSMLSLKYFLGQGSRLIFVALAQQNAREFVAARCKALGLELSAFIELPELTDGQATSALSAESVWDPELPLGIYNIDTFVEPWSLAPGDIRPQSDGWVPCFKSVGDHWSFVRLGDDGWAVESAEKRRISEHATIGFYWFRTAALYSELYARHFAEGGGQEANERYIAPMYKSLIEEGGKVSIASLPVDAVHVLGTPDEVEAFAGKA